MLEMRLGLVKLCVIAACVFWSECLGDLDEMGFLRISFSLFTVKKAVFGSAQIHQTREQQFRFFQEVPRNQAASLQSRNHEVTAAKLLKESTYEQQRETY